MVAEVASRPRPPQGNTAPTNAAALPSAGRPRARSAPRASRTAVRRASAPGSPRNLRRGDDLTATGPGEPPDPAVSADVPFSRPHARRLALSTAIFSAATGVSRILGLFREVVAKN